MNTVSKNHTQTSDLKSDETVKDCWLCKGYGYLPSHSDEPDRICPACQGTGQN